MESSDSSESKQSSLRRSIQAIQRDSSLDASTKARRIQSLMMASYVRTTGEASAHSEVTTTSSMKDVISIKPSYHDESKGIFGCKHYQRGCYIKAQCCGRYFPCRLCHDEASDHAIDRYATLCMVCMHCSTEQPIGQQCSKEECSKVLGTYYCHVCKFHSNDESKAIYHCHDCGLCRLGRGIGIDRYHCKKCNICLHIDVKDDHTCIENSLSSNCPVCHEFMFTSREEVIFNPCGHPMHKGCYKAALRNGNWQCPLCKKSMADMSDVWDIRDHEVRLNVMPEEYSDARARIHCNDCNAKSTIPFHFIGLKCAEEACGSYNTTVLDTTGMPSAPPSGPIVLTRWTGDEEGDDEESVVEGSDEDEGESDEESSDGEEESDEEINDDDEEEDVDEESEDRPGESSDPL